MGRGSNENVLSIYCNTGLPAETINYYYYYLVFGRSSPSFLISVTYSLFFSVGRYQKLPSSWGPWRS